jgi:hypothetical protein
MNVEFFKFTDDYDKLSSIDQCMDTETLLTVEVTESELNRIAEFESQVFNNMAKAGHFNMFETLMEQKKEEQILRQHYPAVKRLHEQYSMMLALAKSGKL